MGTDIQYKISLAVNTALSVLFLLLMVLATVNGARGNDVVFFLVVLFGCSYSAFIAFNIQCYAVIKANRESKQLPQWVQQYGKLLVVLAIIGIIVTAFIFITATFSLIADGGDFPRKQLPYYIFFLVLMLMSVISCIQNIRANRKEKRRNSTIVNSLINDIGSLL